MSQVRGVRLFSILPITFFLLTGVASGTRLEVVVYDEHTREPVSGVNLALTDSARIEVTDERGTALFELPPGWHPLRASHVGYEAAEKEIRLRAKGALVRFFLIPRAWEIGGTVASVARQPEVSGGMELSPVEIHRYPGPTPDPVRFVKVLPGVASGNDFSSAYSVQGGSYAENLVYVNGVEVEAPLQIRRGLAETFSLVNPAMIGRVNFRAGSFPVRYGDRLSSVLDVDYRLPEREWEGCAELSVLQQNLTLGRKVRPNLSFVVGGRRADLGRLARGLQTRGEYRPRFDDVQALVEWTSPQGDRIEAFGAATSSRFRLEPRNQVLRYNCSSAGCDEFRSEVGGQERYEYGTRLLGLRWEREGEEKRRALFVHLLRQEEEEDTDLAYETEWEPLMGDSEEEEEDGEEQRLFLTQRHHSQLELWRWEVGVEERRETWEWGAGARSADLRAEVTGFEGMSAGGDLTGLEDAAEKVDQRDVDGYAYGQRTWEIGDGELTGGLRLVRFGTTGELLLLPRLSGKRRLGARWDLLLAGGLHAQPPLYREFLGAEGNLESQKGAQVMAGVACRLQPTLRVRAELFYRRLTDLISYQLDDMRLIYAGENDARGYAYGLNAHLRGELSRTVGIASYSYLVAREDLAGDGLGYLPRPGDQRHTASVYLEDHMDLRPISWLIDSTFHVRILYGSGFPHTPKLAARESSSGKGLESELPVLIDGERNSRRDRGYFRFDIGMAQKVGLWGWKVELREEVANIFDQFNVVGHTYLPTPDGTPVELRTSLGRRIYKLTLTTCFERI